MLKRLKNMVEELGSVTAFLYILHRLCAASGLPLAVYCYRLVSQPVTAAPLLNETRRAAFSCRRIEADDPALAGTILTTELFARRAAQDAQCYGLFRKNSLIGWLWTVADVYEEDEVRCRFRLPDAAVWDFDVYVDPKQRSGFAFAALWDLVNEDLCSRNIDRCISRISAFNMASRRSHARLGATDLGWMVFIVAGPVQLMLQNGHPRFHLAFSRASRPVVVVNSAST